MCYKLNKEMDKLLYVTDPCTSITGLSVLRYLVTNIKQERRIISVRISILFDQSWPNNKLSVIWTIDLILLKEKWISSYMHLRDDAEANYGMRIRNWAYAT